MTTNIQILKYVQLRSMEILTGKVNINHKFLPKVSLISITCLLSIFIAPLVQANELTNAGNDRRELLSYCYVRQFYELKHVKFSALETKRDLAGIKESTRREVELLNNNLISINERRLGYMRGLLDANDINPNSDLFRQKYDRLVLDDLRSNLRTAQEDRCGRDCLFDSLTSRNRPEPFDLCDKKCPPITVTASLQRARACQSLYVNLR
jgi:hypothetical protein